jgi:hypothetical protein
MVTSLRNPTPKSPRACYHKRVGRGHPELR